MAVKNGVQYKRNTFSSKVIIKNVYTIKCQMEYCSNKVGSTRFLPESH